MSSYLASSSVPAVRNKLRSKKTNKKQLYYKLTYLFAGVVNASENEISQVLSSIYPECYTSMQNTLYI